MQARYIMAVAIAVILGIPFGADSQSTPSLNLEGQGAVEFGACAENFICVGCSPVPCPGTFSATLSGELGGAITSQSLQMTLTVPNFAPILPQPGPSPVPTAVPFNNTSSRAESSRPPTTKEQLQALQQQMQTMQGEIAALQEEVVSPSPQGCVPATGSGAFAGNTYNVGFFGQLCVFTNESNVATLSGTIWIVQNSTTPGDGTWATGTMVASGTPHLFEPESSIVASAPMVVSIVGAVGQLPQSTP